MRNLFTFLGLVLLAMVIWWGCADDPPVAPGEQHALHYVAEPGLLLGPIEGITTVWHVAPRQFAVPRGVEVQLRCLVPPTAEVRWIGATEVARDGTGSTATCPAGNLATHHVQVEVVSPPSGKDDDPRKPKDVAAESRIYQCDFEVVSVGARSIRVSQPRISREPLVVSQSASNWEMLRHYQSGSIAAVREVAGVYTTAVETRVQLEVDVEPPIFAALTEWRVDGEAVLLGEFPTYAFMRPGRHIVEAGPTESSAHFVVDAYRVTIEATNITGNHMPDGVAVNFVAHTEPAGFERFVTWLGATQFGTAEPVMGQGASFTVTFNETTGREELGNIDRWVGVRADNATFNQDGPATGTVEVAVTDSIGDPYAGILVRLEFVGMEATTNGSGMVTFNNVPNGSIAITLIETMTVPNPGGDPVIFDVEVNSLLNVLVTGGLTSHVDCTFIVAVPQEVPGCGTVPWAGIVFGEYGDIFIAVLSSRKEGPCACASNFTVPGPTPAQCPATVTYEFNPKPAPRLWSVVCSTCLGGVNCEQPLATVTASEFR